MAQVTLYLDPETEAKLKAASKAAGISQSRWLANLIREKTAAQWPASVASLAGAWADMPTAEEIRQQAPDAVREPL